MESKSRGQCKIRKRGNSSSSSSSLLQKYRFKRAILVGKRGGSSTPVPIWMTSTKSPTLTMPNGESTKCATSQSGGGKAKEVSVSARKLAATLWEINQVPSPTTNKKGSELAGDKKESGIREKVARLPHLSDPSYFSEKMERYRGNGHRRRTSVSTKKLHVTDYNVRGLDCISNGSLMEIEMSSKGKIRTECVIGIKNRLKDVSNGLTTSKELLKVLNRIWGPDEQHSSVMSLVSALRVELDRARIQVDQLIKDQRSSRNEIEYLVKHFEEEKAAWRSKERDRIRNAIACIAEELEVEKKLRRQTERMNKKLGKELADTKASLSKAMKELESEKRAKEILEQVCDELARGIGEDRAEVEKLKKESAKVREEVEKEREMLQLADVLREERVQMKLLEAKYHFEEKNAAVERLRGELEAYLREKTGNENGDASPNYQRIKELEAYLKDIHNGSHKNAERVENDGVVENGEVHDRDEDSADSDLHSIELNMDNNNRDYQWSYTCEGNNAQDYLQQVSGDKEMKARKSISDNIQWGSIPEAFDRERISNFSLHSQAEDGEDEIKRYKVYKSVKSLRDHILSGSKIPSLQKCASPKQQCGQPLPLQDPGSAVSESSPVLQGDNLKHRTNGNKR